MKITHLKSLQGQWVKEQESKCGWWFNPKHKSGRFDIQHVCVRCYSLNSSECIPTVQLAIRYELVLPGFIEMDGVQEELLWPVYGYRYLILFTWLIFPVCCVLLWLDIKQLNPLHAELFIGNKKNVSTIDIFPLHWHDTGSWNPSSSKTRTYLLYIATIMAADVLVMQGAMASAARIFTMLNWINSVPAR